MSRSTSSSANGASSRRQSLTGTWADRLGTRLRIRMARRYIPPGSRVLDIGCAEGALFDLLDAVVSSGTGVDPGSHRADSERFRFVRGYFPADFEFDADDTYDVVAGLAVLEHVPTQQQPALAEACFRHLKQGGCVILTVPSPVVDRIVAITQWLRIAKAESLHEHYGFDPSRTVPLFKAAGFALAARRRFELGLNNLFVFVRPDSRAGHPVDPDEIVAAPASEAEGKHSVLGHLAAGDARPTVA